MSGIYIPGMEMPTSCFYCPFREKVSPDDYVCMVLNKEFEETFSLIAGHRHKDCPLVPVPPHGDLIDRDKLEKDIDKYIGGEESRSRFHHWVQVQRSVILKSEGEQT